MCLVSFENNISKRLNGGLIGNSHKKCKEHTLKRTHFKNMELALQHMLVKVLTL